MEHLKRSRSASGWNIILGLILFLTPFVFGFAEKESAAANSLLLGAVVFLLAFIRASIPQRSIWMSWLNFILGLWLIIAPFVLSFTSYTAVWANFILGIMISFLSIVSAIETQKAFKQKFIGRLRF